MLVKTFTFLWDRPLSDTPFPLNRVVSILDLSPDLEDMVSPVTVWKQ